MVGGGGVTVIDDPIVTVSPNPVGSFQVIKVQSHEGGVGTIVTVSVVIVGVWPECAASA